jgi:hypothetical protein
VSILAEFTGVSGAGNWSEEVSASLQNGSAVDAKMEATVNFTRDDNSGSFTLVFRRGRSASGLTTSDLPQDGTKIHVTVETMEED